MRVKKATPREVFEITADRRWKGTRTERRSLLYGEALVAWLEQKGVQCLDDITSQHLDDLVQECRRAGRSVSTIRCRLSILYTMSAVAVANIPPLAKRPVPTYSLPNQTQEKWWLTPDARDDLCSWLRGDGGDSFTADYVEFVYHTGLRVEETLRLFGRHFVGLFTDEPSMSVPGLKTGTAQATLPISIEAKEIAIRRTSGDPDVRLFEVGYCTMRNRWAKCRRYLGVTSVPTATLKNLRRSFAKVANDKGMPTEDIRRYLRHTQISTTQEYLRIVGGSDTESLRQWL